MSRTKPRFTNRNFRAELGKTEAGSPIVTIIAENNRRDRQTAAFIYDLAAEMERRSEKFNARWVISPEAWNARVILELASEDEAKAADELIAALLSDLDLA